MAEGAVTFGLLKRVPYASSTDTVFYQLKRFLLGLSRFLGNIRRVAPGLSLAVNTLHSDGLRNPSGKGMLTLTKFYAGKLYPEVKSAKHMGRVTKPCYAAKQHSEKTKFCVVYARAWQRIFHQFQFNAIFILSNTDKIFPFPYRPTDQVFLQKN